MGNHTCIWPKRIVCYCIYIALPNIVCYYIYIQLIYIQWSEVYHQCILLSVYFIICILSHLNIVVWFLYKYIDCTLGMQLSLCCNNYILYYLHLNSAYILLFNLYYVYLFWNIFYYQYGIVTIYFLLKINFLHKSISLCIILLYIVICVCNLLYL